MRRIVIATIAVLIAIASPASAAMQSPRLGGSKELAITPSGYVDFCRRYQGECGKGLTEARVMVPSEKLMAALHAVNLEVNRRVKPLNDLPHWGISEKWDFPDDGFGDCEDYVLLKRKMLIAAGMRPQALLITIVLDHKGRGHAVLTVKTTERDFVLDNLTDEIKVWYATGYSFVKYQSPTNQDLWVRIGPASDVVVVGQ